MTTMRRSRHIGRFIKEMEGLNIKWHFQALPKSSSRPFLLPSDYLFLADAQNCSASVWIQQSLSAVC